MSARSSHGPRTPSPRPHGSREGDAALRRGPATSRMRVRVRGRVQGVGFRPFVHGLARRHHLVGWVLNDDQGVLLEAQGSALVPFVDALRAEAPPLARVELVEPVAVPACEGEDTFVIRESVRTGHVRTPVTPDAAPCDACLHELLDPGDRRHRYPFLNCTHCGPRHTITRSVPYDRPATSMAGFVMCEACSREYHDPEDRRFHAQPTACPVCGPRLDEPVEHLLARLLRGEVVALKGVGGFHLACDAHREDAVARLRQRKDREAKPFAVMVRDVAAARRVAEVDEVAASLLASRARPVVVLPAAARADAPLAASLAPGLRTIGVMLPSSPLHALLLAEAPEGAVFVMTSANRGGEPLVTDDADARVRLAGIADAVVGHDRPIVVRCDDSVLRVADGAPVFLRRARGYVPDAVRLPFDAPPILAVGAHLENTVCFADGREAVVSQHVGDLDDEATLAFWHETVEHLARVLDVTPVAVAHDLHPEMPSTRAALDFAEARGLRTIAVQHHHAHVAAVLAEHGTTGPALGLVLDGFGLGEDGVSSWGGELLAVDGAHLERLGHLAELRQPGGDRAAREPWRMGAAVLHRLGLRDALADRYRAHAHVPALLAMLDKGTRAPLTSSCGRWFDAAASILRVCQVSRYEAEAPILLEDLVTRPRTLEGGFTLERGVLDLLPLFAQLARADVGAAEGADLFHGTLAAGLVALATPEVLRRGLRTIVLAGGCVANAALVHALRAGFARRGISVLLPSVMPAGDGAVSLGQAWVAAHVLRTTE